MALKKTPAITLNNNSTGDYFKIQSSIRLKTELYKNQATRDSGKPTIGSGNIIIDKSARWGTLFNDIATLIYIQLKTMDDIEFEGLTLDFTVETTDV